MRIGFFLIFVISSIGFGFVFHPYYVSMTEMVYNEKSKELEISVRIFADDLEKGISDHCSCKIDLAHRRDSTRNHQLLTKYLNSVLQVQVNSKGKSLSVLGFEKEEESIWTYIETQQTEAIQNLEIRNSILFKVQPKQTNLVRFKAGKFDQTRQLNFPTDRVAFSVANR